ncbi:MAG: flagellar motor protein MotB [Anaerolineaceae bacterium]
MSHGGGSSERWLVSYADFITLLMVLFVVLYSMGQTDLERYRALAKNLKSAFTLGGVPKVVDPQIDQTGGMNADAAAAPIVVDGLPMTSATGQEVAGLLSDLLTESGLSSEVSIQNNVEGVLISLSEKIAFYPGRPELVPESYTVLDTIIDMVLPLENDVKIVGHANSQPIEDARFANSWQLSMARSMTIVDYFISKGVPPERMIASGRGEFDPIFPNDTDIHKALNNRADIIIVYPVSSDVIQLDLRNMPGNSADEGSIEP